MNIEIHKIYSKTRKLLNSDTIFNLSKRFFIYGIVVFTTICIINNNTHYFHFDYSSILSLLISTIAILIAIITTYLFSKLFAEKSERIQRKRIIDELSNKLTSLRKIAFLLKDMKSFWEVNPKNVKHKLDYKYKSLTLEEFRKNTSQSLISELGDSIPQAYLGLRGLEDNANPLFPFMVFTPVNYTTSDILRFKSYTSALWYFLENSEAKYNFLEVSAKEKNEVSIYYKTIVGAEIDNLNFKKNLSHLCSWFDEDIYQKLYYYTNLNEKRTPKLFMDGLINMLIFLIILMISLFIFIINSTPLIAYKLTILSVAFFVGNTVDLVVILWQALKTELTITEFYKI